MVAAVQASLLLSSLGMTHEEILRKYPFTNDYITETIEKELSPERPVDQQYQSVHNPQPLPIGYGANENEPKPVFM